MLDASTRAQTRWFLEMGALSSQQVNDPANAMFVQFYGYLYANMSLARIAAVRAPGVSVDDIDAQYGGVGVLPPYRPRHGDRSLVATLRLGRFASRAFRGGDADRARAAQREVDDWVASLSPVHSTDDASPARAGASGVVVVRTDAPRDDDRDAARRHLSNPDRTHGGRGRRARRRQRDHERARRRCVRRPADRAVGPRPSGQALHTAAGALRARREGLDQRCAPTLLARSSSTRSTRSCERSGSTVSTSSSCRRRSGAPTPSSRFASSSDSGTHPRTATPSERHGRWPKTAAATVRVRQRLRGPRRGSSTAPSAARPCTSRTRGDEGRPRAGAVRGSASSERVRRRHDIARDDIYLLVDSELEAALELPPRSRRPSKGAATARPSRASSAVLVRAPAS